jgi:hypothetical protein
MEWVAIDVDIADDPLVHRLAASLRLRVAEVVGLLTLTFARMAKHAPAGNVASVPDSLIETWAAWEGKRGTFAPHFRAELCDETGTVRAWEHYNGRNIRRAKAASERVRKWREERAQNADVTHNTTHNRTHNVRRTVHNSTEQDLTTNNNKEPKGAATKPPRAVKPKGEGAPWMGLMRGAWTFGSLPPGAATALQPVVTEVGAEEAADRLGNYCAEVEGRFASLRDFVAKHALYAGSRLAVDPATGIPNERGMAILRGASPL